MTELTPRLSQLATAHGVATEFWDWQGRHTEVPVESVVAVLGALGVPVSDEQDVTRALQEVEERPWTRVLPPVVVRAQGQRVEVPVHVPEGVAFDAVLVLEDGERRELGAASDERPTRQLSLIHI